MPLTTYLKHVYREIFSSVNLFISLANIIVFIIFIIAFFWFVLSNQFQTIILDKVSVIIILAKNDPAFNQTLYNFIKNNNITEKAQQQYENRTNHNLQLMFTDLFPFIYAGFVAEVSILIYIILNKIKLSFPEWILLFFVFGAFITDAIVFFTLIYPWQFIGDAKLMSSFVNFDGF